MEKFGINLFSVRKFIADKDNLMNTFKTIKELGYSYAQFSGAVMNPQDVKQAIEEYNIPIVYTHNPAKELLEDPTEIIQRNKLIGCNNVGVGIMTPEAKEDWDVFVKFAKDFDQMALRFQDLGMKLYYHHHAFEFMKPKGITYMDYLVENCPNVNYCLDTYWLQQGGVSVTEYIEKCGSKCDIIHVKDLNVVDGQQFHMAPIGQGNMNWDSIYNACKKVNMKYYLVEQEDAQDYEEPFGQLKISADFLKTL